MVINHDIDIYFGVRFNKIIIVQSHQPPTKLVDNNIVEQ